MEVRIATFNIYWFPSSAFAGNTRAAADLEKIREVVKRLDADALVFQEILDLAALESMLGGVLPARAYSLRDKHGNWTATGADVSDGMKVPLAYDANKLELIEVGRALEAGAPPANKWRRQPVAARLRPLGGGQTLTLVGVHLKSGDLTVGPEPVTDADKDRVEEVKALNKWLTSSLPVTPGGPPRPQHEPTVIIGDFNAVHGNASLAPIAPGAQSAWRWPTHRFASALSPQPVDAHLPPGERWTTHLDKKIIDHVLVSPEVELLGDPWVYAFDKDSSWLQAAGVTPQWMEKLEYPMTPSTGPTKRENLHRISDHRPVRVSIDL